MVDAPAPIDWIEEGKKHFVQTKIKPAALCQNYPWQDQHPPQAERDFILGFKAAEAAWERGEQLSGMQAYVIEMDEQGYLQVKANG